MEEQGGQVVGVARLLPAGVGPPVAGRLAGRGDHGRHQHDQADGQAVADERRREPSHRLGHDHDVGPVARRLDHRVGVVGQAGRVVVHRQVGRYHVVTGGP